MIQSYNQDDSSATSFPLLKSILVYPSILIIYTQKSIPKTFTYLELNKRKKKNSKLKETKQGEIVQRERNYVQHDFLSN